MPSFLLDLDNSHTYSIPRQTLGQSYCLNSLSTYYDSLHAVKTEAERDDVGRVR